MRADIKMLCVTNWGALLELVTNPYITVSFLTRYEGVKKFKDFNNLLTVADPDAIDAGMVIGLNDIKLVARRKGNG